MELPLARLCKCPRCGQMFLVCSRCDRGQLYCCSACSQAARRDSLRAAGRRYQNSRSGRHRHAARQRRYRARRKKVTHQGSPPQDVNAAIPVGPIVGADEVLTSPVSAQVQEPVHAAFPSPPTHCHFCGCLCAPFVRLKFLRHRRAPQSIIISDVRGGKHGHSP